MRRLVHATLTGLTLAAMASVYVHFGPRLPPVVAQTFGGDGQPVGYATRETFWWFVAGMVVVMIASFHGLGALLRRRGVTVRGALRRDGTADSATRDASAAWLETWMVVTGNVTIAYLAVVTALVCRANVDRAPLDGLGAASLALVVAYTIAVALLVRRVRRER